jgi:hypothetical protein
MKWSRKALVSAKKATQKLAVKKPLAVLALLLSRRTVKKAVAVVAATEANIRLKFQILVRRRTQLVMLQ